jgi:hypothetical protein
LATTSATDVKAEFIWMSPEVGETGTYGGDDGLGGYSRWRSRRTTTTAYRN